MNKAIEIFTDYRKFQIFILGIFSVTTLTIICSTLATWMKHMRVDITVITTFAVARVFYSLKFLWVPFIDAYKTNTVDQDKQSIVAANATFEYLLGGKG